MKGKTRRQIRLAHNQVFGKARHRNIGGHVSERGAVIADSPIVTPPQSVVPDGMVQCTCGKVVRRKTDGTPYKHACIGGA